MANKNRVAASSMLSSLLSKSLGFSGDVTESPAVTTCVSASCGLLRELYACFGENAVPVLKREVLPFLQEALRSHVLPAEVMCGVVSTLSLILRGPRVNVSKAANPATLIGVSLTIRRSSEECHKAGAEGSTGETAGGGEGSAASNEGFARLLQASLHCLVDLGRGVSELPAEQQQVEFGDTVEVLSTAWQHCLSSGNASGGRTGTLRLFLATAMKLIEVHRENRAGSTLDVPHLTTPLADSFPRLRAEDQCSGLQVLKALHDVVIVQRLQTVEVLTPVLDQLRTVTEVSHKALASLLDWCGGDTAPESHMTCVRSGFPLHVLLSWLPSWSNVDLQIATLTTVKAALTGHDVSLALASGARCLDAVLSGLSRHRDLAPSVVDQLLDLACVLGGQSLTGANLRRFFSAIAAGTRSGAVSHSTKVLRSLAEIASRSPRHSTVTFLCHDKAAGIRARVPEWGGKGLSFCAWVRVLEPEQAALRSRTLVYSVRGPDGSGHEAFITHDGRPVVCTYYSSDSVEALVYKDSCSLADGNWHLLGVSHAQAKGLQASHLDVFLDGKHLIRADVKLPTLRGKIECGIGVSTFVNHHRGLHMVSNPDTGNKKSQPNLLNKLSAFVRPSQRNTSQTETLSAVGVDTTWGPATALVGELTLVALVKEGLTEQQLQLLHNLGPHSCRFDDLYDVDSPYWKNKGLLVLHPQAVNGASCFDLSGHVTDIQVGCEVSCRAAYQRSLECCGGANALLNILELAPLLNTRESPGPGSRHSSPAKSSARGVSVEKRSERGFSLDGGGSEESDEEWCVVDDETLDLTSSNSVACFMALLRCYLRDDGDSMEAMANTSYISIVSSLLYKVPSHLLSEGSLSELQRLYSAIAPYDTDLARQIVKLLLFDFSLWGRSRFPVRISHIQNAFSILKDDRSYFKNHFGVSFFYDNLRTSLSDSRRGLSPADVQAVRQSLLAPGQLFLRSPTMREVTATLAFLACCSDPQLRVLVLEQLTSLVESASTSDQLTLLMFEKSTGPLLLAALTEPHTSPEVKVALLKTLVAMLKKDAIQPKFKQWIYRVGSDNAVGLPIMMQGQEMTEQLALTFLHFIGTMADHDSKGATSLCLALLQLLPSGDVTLKRSVVKGVLSLVVAKPEVGSAMANTEAWSHVLCGLFVREPRPSSGNGAGTVDHSCCVGPPLMFEAESNDVKPAEPDQEEVTGSDVASRGGSGSGADAPGSEVFSASSSDGRKEEATGNGQGKTDAVSTRPSSLSLRSSVDGAPSPSPYAEFTPFFSGRDRSASGTSLKNAAETLLYTQVHDFLTSHGIDAGRTFGEGETSEEQQMCQDALVLAVTLLVKDTLLELMHEKSDRMRACIVKLSRGYSLWCDASDLLMNWVTLVLQATAAIVTNLGAGDAIVTAITPAALRAVYVAVEQAGTTTWAGQEVAPVLLEKSLEIAGVLEAFHHMSSWPEVASLTLAIVLAYAKKSNMMMCSMSCARLHQLLDQREGRGEREEMLWVLYELHLALELRIDDATTAQFLLPVVKMFVKQLCDRFDLSRQLSSMPSSGSVDYAAGFVEYWRGQEWRRFIAKNVRGSARRYVEQCLTPHVTTAATALQEAAAQLRLEAHRHNRAAGKAKLRFQSEVWEPWRQLGNQDDQRRRAAQLSQLQLRRRSLAEWRAVAAALTSHRGPWGAAGDGEGMEVPRHWKLSNKENFSRMKLILVPNDNFDPHTEASMLRDSGQAPPAQPTSLPVVLPATEAEEEEDEIKEEDLDTLKKDGGEGAKVILKEECEVITLVDTVPGTLTLTPTHLFFRASAGDNGDSAADFDIELPQLREIHFRRYNLRRSALEFFLLDQRNYFLNFTKKTRNLVFSRVVSLKPPSLRYFGTRSPAEVLKASGLTQKWVNREVSNFDYLMHLNTIAGRTYNDLSQYPVFPWILKDYTSETIDLEDPAVYRDLAKPVGVQNPRNENIVRDKYKQFEDPSGQIPKFHYGTHYSSAAVVMHYLVRLEPYTSLHIQLQGDKFDVADRQFYSIANSWAGLVENPNDVKELIPEFFYMPEFLVNSDGFDLGELQRSHKRVNDVTLPPWASSPEDFVQKHREALESEHVSNHLHEWVDLIFGHKQRGPAAAEALNVFYYCTYEGAVDLDAVKDQFERKALEGMINNFGQTPSQLLKEPHPRRQSIVTAAAKAVQHSRPFDLLWFPHSLKPYCVQVHSDNDAAILAVVPRNQAQSVIHKGMPDKLVTVSRSGVIGTHSWQPSDPNVPHFFTFERDPSFNTQRSLKKLGSPFSPSLLIGPQLVVVSHDSRLVITAGQWDGSLRCYNVEKRKSVAVRNAHSDVVTCVAMDEAGRKVASGSRDTTVRIWRVRYNKGGFSSNLSEHPLMTLVSHDAEVTAVKLSSELDVIVSGDKGGRVCLHSLREGQHIRDLCTSGAAPIHTLCLSTRGYVMTYTLPACSSSSKDTGILRQYTIGGRELCSTKPGGVVRGMAVTDNHLILGLAAANSGSSPQAGCLVLTSLTNPKRELSRLVFHAPVTSVSVTRNNTHILAPLTDGKLIVIAHNTTPPSSA